MPTYDYQCSDCGNKFEAFQSITAEPLTECPVCKGKVKRLISGGTGLIFKGSGFYITDYQNKKTSGADSKAANGENKKADTDVKKETPASSGTTSTGKADS